MKNPEAFCKHSVMHRNTDLEEADDYLVWQCQNLECRLIYHIKAQAVPEPEPIMPRAVYKETVS